jgi:hypothetical protein
MIKVAFSKHEAASENGTETSMNISIHIYEVKVLP